jgi:hypothetical protein
VRLLDDSGGSRGRAASVGSRRPAGGKAARRRRRPPGSQTRSSPNPGRTRRDAQTLHCLAELGR